MTASRTLPHTAPFEHVREPELEQRLARHYDELRDRDPVPTDAAARHRLAALMAHEMSAVEATGTAEAARQASAAARATGARATPGEAPASTRRAGLVALLATQARFISPLTWVAQLGLALLAALVAALDATGELAGVAVPVIGAAMVLAESPALLKSKRHGVDELEYSCPLDCRGVLLARMIVLGCSGVLALTCMAVAMPLAGPTTSLAGVATPLATLVHSCVPYFLGCVGSLVAVRRASAENALALAAVWVTLVIAVSAGLYVAVPAAYQSASLGTWGLAGGAALLWMLGEARRALRQAGAGLDATRPARLTG